MINKRKLFGILGVSILSMSTLVGCSSDNEKTPDINVEEEQIEEEQIEEENTTEQSIEDILLTYNEDGMKYLKANYPDLEDMELGIKNIGKELSDLKLKSIDGKDVNLNQFKGKKVVFVIAQDSCSYCMDNEPVLEKVFKENKDIEIVYVFENSSVEGIKTYYKDLGLELPKNVWIDDNNDLVSEFNLKKTPTMVFVDESNKVSLIKQTVYDEVILNDDISFAFGEDKIYNMKVE